MVTIEPMLLLPLLPPLLAVWYLSRTWDPKRLSARILGAWTTGFLALWLWNLTPLLHLGINSLSAVTAGALGLPGLGLLAGVKLL